MISEDLFRVYNNLFMTNEVKKRLKYQNSLIIANIDNFMFLTGYIVLINIVLALFNLVPIPPLDGSKILFSIFPNKLYGLRKSLEGIGFVLVLIFIFFFWQFISPLAFKIFSLLVGGAMV